MFFLSFAIKKKQNIICNVKFLLCLLSGITILDGGLATELPKIGFEIDVSLNTIFNELFQYWVF